MRNWILCNNYFRLTPMINAQQIWPNRHYIYTADLTDCFRYLGLVWYIWIFYTLLWLVFFFTPISILLRNVSTALCLLKEWLRNVRSPMKILWIIFWFWLIPLLLKYDFRSIVQFRVFFLKLLLSLSTNLQKTITVLLNLLKYRLRKFCKWVYWTIWLTGTW